jgi:tetratricopeptide (TPR) repeat protein
MAASSLTKPSPYADLFRRQVFANIQYWQNFVTHHPDDIATLDAERDCILKAITFALDLEDAWSHVYELVVNFSSFMERRGYWESWHRILYRALQVARQINDVGADVNLSNLLARLLFQRGRFHESVSYYRQAIHTARQIGDRFNEARACSNLGYYYIERGHFYRAEVLCCHALKKFEIIDNDHGCAHTENHLGILYTRQCLWDIAEQYLRQACAIWEAIGDKHGLMRGFLNLSLLYNEMERPKTALNYLKKAMNQAKLTGEETVIATIHLNMSAAYILNGELRHGEMYALQAETGFRKFSDRVGVALAWNNLAAVYTHLKEWDQAREYLEAALEICHKLKDEHCEIKVLMSLVEYELARENSQQATERLEELEQFMQSGGRSVRFCQLQTQLTKYRRSLSKLSSDKLRQIESAIS